jgi:hypothetical protein
LLHCYCLPNETFVFVLVFWNSLHGTKVVKRQITWKVMGRDFSKCLRPETKGFLCSTSSSPVEHSDLFDDVIHFFTWSVEIEIVASRKLGEDVGEQGEKKTESSWLNEQHRGIAVGSARALPGKWSTWQVSISPGRCLLGSRRKYWGDCPPPTTLLSFESPLIRMSQGSFIRRPYLLFRKWGRPSR